MKETGSYALRFLRERSYPHYFSVLFAPAGKRAGLAALYAFQYEILTIGRQVKEPLLGEMRLNYWQESLKAIFPQNNQSAEILLKAEAENKAAEVFAASGQSPLIRALAAAAQEHDLPLAPFLELCEAARFGLYQRPMLSSAALETYCETVYGAVWQISCLILGKKGAVKQNQIQIDIDAACRHGGIAQGIAEIVQNLPHSLRQGKQPAPQDILLSLGIDWQSFCRTAIERPKKAAEFDSSAAAEKRLIAALAAYFRQHYTAFKQAEKNLPAALRPAFLPLAVLPGFMKQAEKRKDLLPDGLPPLSRLRQQGKILRAALFNHF